MKQLPQTRLAQNPLLVLAVAFCIGIFIGHYISAHLIFFVAASLIPITCLGLASIWFIYRDRLAVATSLIVVAYLGAGLALSASENRGLRSDRLKRMFEDGLLVSNSPVELTARLEGQPEPALDGFYLTVEAESIAHGQTETAASGTVLLLAHADDQAARGDYQQLELRDGARIRVMTMLDRDEEFRNPGVLPFTEYLDRKNYDATGVIKSPLLVERLDDAPVFLPLAWIYEWREQLQKQIERLFSTETAGILDAVLLGNRHSVTESVAERFRAGGTFHFLVIAGLHISFIAALVFWLMRRIVRHRVVQFTCATSFIAAYAIAVGAQLPVVRAASVFSLAIFAPLVWRRAASLNVIAAAALALLIRRPNDLFDPSFQLTFLSVISIVTIAVPLISHMQSVGSWRPTHATPNPPMCSRWFRSVSEALFWSERAWKLEIASSNVRYRLFKNRWAARLERWRLQRLLRFAAAAVILTASVQIGMLPLLIVYFHRISFSSLILNVVMGAAMAVFVFIALMAIVLAQFSAWIAAPFVVVAERLERLMVHLVDPFSGLGVAAMRLPHYHGWFATIYVLYFASLTALVVMLNRWSPLRPQTTSGHKPTSRRLAAITGVAFGLVVFVIVLHPLSATRPDGKLHVNFLDVGQGDSALVTMPNGATLLIDGGGRPNFRQHNEDEFDPSDRFERDKRSVGERVVSEYLWSCGLDRVDYLLPTHANTDHIDGLNDIAQNFAVRGAIVARTPINNAEYTKFAQTMKTIGIPIERVGAGDSLRFGDVLIDILWPPSSDDIHTGWPNNEGTVLRIRYGKQSLLFMADIERQVEAALLQRTTDLHSDVVKVAHHGSKTSSIAAFVAATSPSVAIISVGRNSPFGHPNKEVVDRWRASGAQILTTGENGTISVVTDGRQLDLSTFVQH